MNEFENDYTNMSEEENKSDFQSVQETADASENISSQETYSDNRFVETEEKNNECFEDDATNEETHIWNRVNYSPVEADDYNVSKRGIKVFCAIMAGVILLTVASVSGYFLGRGSVNSGFVGNKVSVDLASKPKNTDQMTAAQVYEKLNHSIVGIRVYNSQGDASDASGVLYTEEGYIITNDHIYSEIGAPKFKVFMYDGTEHDATYVAGDTVSDLAILKIEGGDFDVPEFGNSDELVCGESVVAIGRPSDATDNSSITCGIISLTKRRVKTTSDYTARLIQTDSAINPGSSGGALINMYGQVVGITSSKLAGVQYDAIGFAIPTTTVKRIAEQLIEYGRVEDRAKLGITYTEVSSVTAEINDYDNVGLYVVSVGEDSDIYGKVNEGDIITAVNGIAITKDDIVLDIIEDCQAGDKITLTVASSKGGTSDFEVTLKANIGQSSYSEVISSDDSSNSSSGETFNFPFGE